MHGLHHVGRRHVALTYRVAVYKGSKTVPRLRSASGVETAGAGALLDRSVCVGIHFHGMSGIKGGHHLISGGGRDAGFRGWTNIFLHYDPADFFSFQLLGHQKLFISPFQFIYFNHILKAIIYLNSWQVQIIYFTIILP